jgi:arylsulfatase A-like enzyme
MLLREWLSDKETFSFINIPVAHGPYDPPERFCKAVGASPSSGDPFVDEQNIHRYITGEVSPSEAAWDDLQALYAAGVVHADYLVGRLLERAPDDTWVILTADHGEHLGEHGRFGHQFSLYDELIRVPLIISHPSLDPRRRSDLVSHIDISPTIMNILDQNDNDTESTGRSLLAQPEEDRTVFAEYGPPAAHMNALNNNTNTINQETFDRLFRGIQAAITPKYKLLRYSDGTEELYHRDREGADALEKYPEVASDLRADMDRSLDGLPEVDESEFNDYVRGDVSDQLESLGYL